jgi:hypothetical protein
MIIFFFFFFAPPRTRTLGLAPLVTAISSSLEVTIIFICGYYKLSHPNLVFSKNLERSDIPVLGSSLEIFDFLHVFFHQVPKKFFFFFFWLKISLYLFLIWLEKNFFCQPWKIFWWFFRDFFNDFWWFFSIIFDDFFQKVLMNFSIIFSNFYEFFNNFYKFFWDFFQIFDEFFLGICFKFLMNFFLDFLRFETYINKKQSRPLDLMKITLSLDRVISIQTFRAARSVLAFRVTKHF